MLVKDGDKKRMNFSFYQNLSQFQQLVSVVHITFVTLRSFSCLSLYFILPSFLSLFTFFTEVCTGWMRSHTHVRYKTEQNREA